MIDLENQDAARLLCDFRLAPPDYTAISCSFCPAALPAEYMHAEEGGDWACCHCVNRWIAKNGIDPVYGRRPVPVPSDPALCALYL